jgi:PmbA protein
MKEKNLLYNANLKEMSHDILKEAKRAGAQQAEVNIAINKGFSVCAREASAETVEYHQDKIVEIDVYIGNRTGSASISDMRPEAIRYAIEAACHIAKFTDEDNAAGLADKTELAFDYAPLALSYPWSISVEQAIQLACECEREALAADKRIHSAEQVAVTTVEGLQVYANSNGFLGDYTYTRHEISCVLVAKQGEEMQRDYSYSITADPTKLASIHHLAQEAAHRTVQRLGARRLRTMRVPVIFIAEEARGLLGHFAAAISGSHLYRKSSFLIDHLDKPIFPSFIQIQEQPHLPGALGSAPFDEDGVNTRENQFVENGVLRSYALGVYSARKLGMKTTGNAGGMHNLTVSHGTDNLSQLLKRMGKGLLITEMMGQGANLVTGDYSRGVGGYWVEGGEIQYPVQEITVAGRLQDIYAHVVAVGNDVDKRGNIRTGSILIEDMMVAGD